MDVGTDTESVVIQQRAAFLNDVSNAAQAAQQAAQRTSVGELSDTAFNLRSLNTSQAPPFDPYRGRNLDIYA
jgi:hypothetical protein